MMLTIHVCMVSQWFDCEINIYDGDFEAFIVLFHVAVGIRFTL